MSKVIVHDYWRHFQPEAPVIQQTLYKNTSVEIPMRKYLVQGARDLNTGDFDPTVLAAIGAQRGWNLNIFIPNQPAHGRATMSNVSWGITYQARRDYIGPDCINYVLNVNGQNSTYGRIELIIEDFFSVSVQPYRTGNQFRYVATHVIPPNRSSGWRVLHSWYHRRPVRIYNNQTGRFEVHTQMVQWYGSVYEGLTHQLIVAGDQTPYFTYTWPDPNLTGFIAGTDEPYLQPDGPFPLVLISNFVKEPNIVNGIWNGTWNESYTTTLDLELELGPEWWESGQVLAG